MRIGQKSILEKIKDTNGYKAAFNTSKTPVENEIC